MRAKSLTLLVLPISSLLGLPACSSAGADNTKFAATCLKSASEARCTCMQAAVRTSLDDNDFQQVATTLTPGQFGNDGDELQYNIEHLVGARNHLILGVSLENCVGALSPLDGGLGLRGFPKQFDENGRFLDGPRKGKRMYEKVES